MRVNFPCRVGVTAHFGMVAAPLPDYAGVPLDRNRR